MLGGPAGWDQFLLRRAPSPGVGARGLTAPPPPPTELGTVALTWEMALLLLT